MSGGLVSKKTRSEFREWLVGSPLRVIRELFDDRGVALGSVPASQLPGGDRRSLVEEYYASIDWSNPTDVQKILNVYEDIMLDVVDRDPSQLTRFKRLLERDGYEYEGSRIVATGLDADIVASVSSGSLDCDHLDRYVDRINSSIDSDPALAIGSTKELVEAVLKTILDARGTPYDRHEDVPKLLKRVQGALQLIPGDVEETKKGAEIIRRTLGSIGSVVVGVAELRNLYGTGHGHGRNRGGLRTRHARLVVGAGVALCRFLLETQAAREGLEV